MNIDEIECLIRNFFDMINTTEIVLESVLN